MQLRTRERPARPLLEAPSVDTGRASLLLIQSRAARGLSLLLLSSSRRVPTGTAGSDQRERSQTRWPDPRTTTDDERAGGVHRRTDRARTSPPKGGLTYLRVRLVARTLEMSIRTVDKCAPPWTALYAVFDPVRMLSKSCQELQQG